MTAEGLHGVLKDLAHLLGRHAHLLVLASRKILRVCMSSLKDERASNILISCISTLKDKGAYSSSRWVFGDAVFEDAGIDTRSLLTLNN